MNGFEEPLRHLLDPNSERVDRLGKSATPGFPILGAGTKSQLLLLLLLQGIPQGIKVSNVMGVSHTQIGWWNKVNEFELLPVPN